jgi:prolyl-tRNA synthetase
MKTNKEYISLIEDGGIFSYSPARGTFILPPNGLLLWSLMKEYLRKNFSLLGVKEVSMPCLIPFSLFNKEKKHIQGFSPELFHVQSEPLSDNHNHREDMDLVLRPTSEVVFYEWFSRILKSYRQLPIIYNQWCKVFRIEKNIKPFLRNSEFLWQEGHTLHSNSIEAEKFAFQIIELYRKYVEEFLCISSISGLKTECEKFAGAVKTYSVECILPDNQCLQLATSHFFSDSFSKTFKVEFSSQENFLKNPFSTSWGTSTRSIGALALSHYDEKGLVFPFDVSPVQVGLIKYRSDCKIDSYVSLIEKEISKHYRVKVYEKSSSSNLNIKDCDKEGCSFKVIIGKNEAENQSLTVCTRISNEKEVINKELLISFIEERKISFSKFLKKKSLEKRLSSTFEINSYGDFIRIIKDEKKGFFIVPFCNVEICENNFKKNFSPLSFRCILEKGFAIEKTCIFCDRKSSCTAVLGRSY